MKVIVPWYFHDKCTLDEIREFIEDAGLDPDKFSELALEQIRDIIYEVKLEIEIDQANGDPRIITVNDKGIWGA